MLMLNTDKPFLERACDYFDVMDLALSMGPLVYTPLEFNTLISDPFARLLSERSVTDAAAGARFSTLSVLPAHGMLAWRLLWTWQKS